MDGSKDIQSDSTEPQKKSTKPDTFFKKYTLSMPPEPGTANEATFKKYVPPRTDSDEPIFKKYVPLSTDSNESDADQPLAEELDLSDASDPGAPITKGSKRRAPVHVWWGVAASAILILAGWMILNTLLHVRERHTQQIEPDKTSSAGETSSDAGANASELYEPPPSGSLDSVPAEQLDEKVKNPSKPSRPQGLVSTEFQHNIMLARAREFEDRGMLLRAEEEYRALASSFPGDTFSQAGLSRVQSILSAKRQNEMSRLSREAGLKKFTMSDYAGAEKDLAAAVNAGRTDTATLYAMGMSYVKLGYYDKAKTTLDQCIAGSPDYAPALVGLAQANAATGREDQAVPLLQRALELGGGAEFTPAKIREMISKLVPEQAVTRTTAWSPPRRDRSQPTFSARVVHGHALTWCSGDLVIVNSVVHFNASNPSHSFQVLSSEVKEARVTGDELLFNVNGKNYRFTVKGRPARGFLDALVP
jgi:Tetratricopeptide repeat